MTDENPKADDHITITIDGNEHELFMTYGLLNRLLKCVGSDVDALAAGMVSDLRDKLFAEALNKRGKSGAFEKFTADKLDDINMSSEDAQRLLSWVTGHVLSFFIGVAENARATEAKYATRTAALTQSPNGMPG